MDSFASALFVICVLMWLAPWQHPIVPITMVIAFTGGVLRLYHLWSHPRGWYTT